MVSSQTYFVTNYGRKESQLMLSKVKGKHLLLSH